MRNLEILHRKEVFNRWDEDPYFAYCCGADGDIVVCSPCKVGQGPCMRYLNKSRGREIQCFLPGHPCRPHRIQYVGVVGTLFAADEEGSFLQGREVGEVVEWEQLFDCAQGILEFAVSPDARRVAILTKEKTLLILSMPDLGCMAVNQWLEEGMTCVDDYKGTIVWRKDSRYVAINVPNSASSREIRVYEEDGNLYSVSKLDEFEIINQVLAWQPSGGLLACYGEPPSKNKSVVFMELNGLKRSHFELPGQQDASQSITKLDWNGASDILSIQFEEEIQLWTRSNYVWMLKQRIAHGKSSDRMKSVKFSAWDAENNYKLLVLYSKSCFTYDICHKFTFGQSKGSALVVSWDGNKAYATPLRDNSAPPPFGFLHGQVNARIIDAIVPTFYDGILVISEEGVTLFRRPSDSSAEFIIADSALFPENFLPHEVEGWCWPNIVTLCCTLDGELLSAMLRFSNDENATNERSKKTLTFKKENRMTDNSLLRLFPIPPNDQSDFLIGETNNNCLVRICLTTKDISQILPSFPGVTLSTFQITPFHLGSADTKIAFILYDPQSGQVYFASGTNLLRIFGQCTSVFKFSDTILLTTLQGSLEMMRQEVVTNLLETGMGTVDLNKVEGRVSRKVERGSVIVACCINRLAEPTLVLEIIPRGNFETICPRPLLETTVRSLLHSDVPLKYDKIMTTLRRHRLDYRVLIDEMRRTQNGASVDTSLKAMVNEVQNSHSLVLLVTDLDGDEYRDCIQLLKNILEEYLNNHAEENAANVEEAFLASLAKLGLLEEALMSKLIKGESPEKRNIVTHRVKFLSYYCDNPNILFDTALGTYNLTLASTVADCLGKDPKEYVPILDELNDLPELKMKFEVDDKLRRYSKAVFHLTRDPLVSQAQVLKYTGRHRLFTDVISDIEKQLNEETGESGFRRSADLLELLQQTRASYGEYLEEHAKFLEAAILYRRGRLWDKVIECSIKCGDWETAMNAIYTNGSGTVEQQRLQNLGNRLLKVLEERKNFAGAARLCETYLHELPKAVDYWMKAGKWITANSLASLIPNFDMTVIRNKINEAMAERKEQLQSLNQEITLLFNRWKIVKEIKAKKVLEGEDIGDGYSDTDSLSSYSTRSGSSSAATGKTYRSGKNKRKMERKVYSMREGSRHEDLGITAHLWNVFDKISQELKADTSEMIRCLWEFNEDDKAMELGAVLDNLLDESGKVVCTIWSQVLSDELLELKFRTPPHNWSTTWDKLCLHEPSSKAVKQ